MQHKGPHKDRTPHEVFSGINIAAETRHHHTFGCPVYVTATQIQAGKSLPAWMTRAKVGINLGISPTHARSVALVLSLKTGLVSPQFHVKHDDLFETTGYKVWRFELPASRWQALAGFKKGTISVTRQAEPAETKDLRGPSTARKTDTNVVDRYSIADDAAVEGEAPVDDIEEATVTIQPDPGEEDEEVPINQGEPSDGEPTVTTRSGRKV
jgi:pullulanase/glycogen debranching enzyme